MTLVAEAGTAAVATVVQLASRVGERLAAPAAADVDREGRFPAEAIAGLKEAGLLGALVPRELGGLGASLGEVQLAVTELAKHCASTAMIFAMHQIQVACLVNHGRNDVLRELTREVATGQLLLASATTEKGIGGDVRSSSCAVEIETVDDRPRFKLAKNAPVISYGQHADAVLVTARRTPDSTPNDQVIVACRTPGLHLHRSSTWSAMGMRGTCSDGFELLAEGDPAQIIDDPYGDVSAKTMLPVSHILWAGVWLGVATAAVDKARAFVRLQARNAPGTTPPAAIRLAETYATLSQLRDVAHHAVTRYATALADPDQLDSLGFSLAMNTTKTQSTTLVVDVVNQALGVCGILGYREDTPFSMGRLLRDAHGGAVMVANDRITANNAQLLLVHKGI
jgi:acyl-CoA dehydrogenase